jgi:beta-N-acetylhexosaminidase
MPGISRSRWLLALLLVFLLSHPGGAPQEIEAALDPQTEQERWVEETLAKMSLEEKIGQLLLVYYYGGFTSAESPEYRELIEYIERKHVGGFVVRTRGTPLGFDRSYVYPTAVLANQLQRKAKIPLLVAADFERGTAMRLVEGTSFPQAMAVAATGNPKDAYEMGRVTALEARAAGVHWVFAPVADVNINPQNPIINIRAFGEDPAQVSAYVAEFTRGVEEHGALSTAKHFPGHGDTSVDSHVDLPTVRAGRERIESVELAPFRAAIAAGASTIMTGHLALPVLEPDPELPATLSPRILTDLLRREMGFQGMVVTDALDMGGVTVRYPPAEVAARSILAGADVLLVPPLPDAAITSLLDGVESGRLPLARVEESVRRVLRAKARLGLHKERLIDVEALNEKFGRPEFAAAAQGIADRGVTLLRDNGGLVPLDATRPARVLLAAIAGDSDVYPGETFERELRWRVDSLQVVRSDTRWVLPENVKLPAATSYDIAVVALFVRVADRKGTVGLPEKQAELVRQILAAGKPTVVVSFGSPYLIERFPKANSWLAAFSTVDVVQRAAARALYGQVGIGGKIPVTVPGVAQLGDGLTRAANPMALRAASPRMLERLKPVFERLDQAVAERDLSGGALAVGHRGELAVYPFGKTEFAAGAAAVGAETALRAGSLANPVVVATAVALLVERGRVALDAPVARYIPEWAEGAQPERRAKLTVKHLLLGSSGLPAQIGMPRPANDTQATPRVVVSSIVQQPLEFEPGTQLAPSPLEWLLLGEIVRRVSGQDPAEFLAKVMWPHFWGRQTGIGYITGESWRYAPDARFRSGTVRAQTTPQDLAAFAQTLLNGGIYAHERLLRRATIQQFVTRQAVGTGARALGWDAGPWGGAPLSRGSFGVDDATGASLWVDPEKELFVIFLPAEVAAGAEAKVQAIRAGLHAGIVEALATLSR